MASVVVDADGIPIIDKMGQTINGTYYAPHIMIKRRGKLNKIVLFHQDNVPAHKYGVAMVTIIDHSFALITSQLLT